MEREIFISYSRKDLERVKDIKKMIEQETGVHCWMDLKAIESGAPQYTQDIVDGINSCQTFLFMLSKESQKSRFALRELNLASKKAEQDKQKHVVIVNIDDCKMCDEFFLMYGLTDTIAWSDTPQREKLLRDLKSWKCLWNNRVKTEDQRNTSDEETKIDDEEVIVKVNEEIDENTVMYEHYIKINQSPGKYGMMIFWGCIGYLVIIAGVVMIWFNPNDFWWFKPTLISFAIFAITFLCMHIHYNYSTRLLKLTEKQIKEFVERNRREYDIFKEMNRKKKLGLLKKDDLIKLEKSKEKRKELSKGTDFDGIASVICVIATIIVWVMFW